MRVHPALHQNLPKLGLQSLTDGLAGWEKVPVGNGLLTLNCWPQRESCLLKYISTHVLQDRAHDHHTGQRERDTDRQTHRDRHRDRDRDRERQTDRHTETDTETETETERHRQTDTQRHRQRERDTDRQTHRDRHRDRDRDRERERERPVFQRYSGMLLEDQDLQRLLPTLINQDN